MPWKPEYDANRRARIASDPEYAERYRSNAKRNARTPEENRDYMRAYYAANKHRWKRSRESQDKINARRRERYASDPDFAAECKKFARARCKTAKRNERLQSTFGITIDEYDAILAKQGGGCAICNSKEGDRRGWRLHVDHCHRTGKVRGLLCSACNIGLGKFKDNADRLARAIEYLWESNR